MLEMTTLQIEDKPAHRSGYSLSLSLSFLVFLEFVSILFRSISAFSIDVAYTIDFKCPHKWKSNGFNSVQQDLHDQSIYLQSVDLKIAYPLG